MWMDEASAPSAREGRTRMTQANHYARRVPLAVTLVPEKRLARPSAAQGGTALPTRVRPAALAGT